MAARAPAPARAGGGSGQLARRWLRACGPAAVADLKWWSRWTLKQTRAALAAIGAVEVDLDGRATLFDGSGNAGPTVWWDGRIVGGWAARKHGGVSFRLLEEVGSEAAEAVEAEAARLAAWLGEATLIPRFGTPLEGELAGHR